MTRYVTTVNRQGSGCTVPKHSAVSDRPVRDCSAQINKAGCYGTVRTPLCAPLQGIAHVLSKLHERYGTTVHPERFQVSGGIANDYKDNLIAAWDAIWETRVRHGASSVSCWVVLAIARCAAPCC